MPIKPGDLILVVSSRDFAKEIGMTIYSKPTSPAQPEELEGKLMFIGTFISQDLQGNMWVKIEFEEEKDGLECFIPHDTILFAFSDPSKEIIKKIGFKLS